MHQYRMFFHSVPFFFSEKHFCQPAINNLYFVFFRILAHHNFPEKSCLCVENICKGFIEKQFKNACLKIKTKIIVSYKKHKTGRGK